MGREVVSVSRKPLKSLSYEASVTDNWGGGAVPTLWLFFLMSSDMDSQSEVRGGRHPLAVSRELPQGHVRGGVKMGD